MLYIELRCTKTYNTEVLSNHNSQDKFNLSCRQHDEKAFLQYQGTSNIIETFISYKVVEAPNMFETLYLVASFTIWPTFFIRLSLWYKATQPTSQ